MTCWYTPRLIGSTDATSVRHCPDNRLGRSLGGQPQFDRCRLVSANAELLSNRIESIKIGSHNSGLPPIRSLPTSKAEPYRRATSELSPGRLQVQSERQVCQVIFRAEPPL